MTIVLSGSLGADRRMWAPQVAGGIAGLVVEHPGHGGAPLAAVADVSDLAAAVLAQVRRGRHSFVGVSLGGAVAMRIALDAPARVERLALISSSARFGEPAAWRERAATVRERGLGELADILLARWFTPEFRDVRRYREMLLSTDPEGYAGCCDALARWDVRDALARIDAPTLVVSGAEDPVTPPADGELLASAIPRARHVVVPDARHLPNVERPEMVNALLAEYLA